MEPTKEMVYIVDDDPRVREALSSLLRASGKDVQTFSSGQDPANARCRLLHGFGRNRFDLLLHAEAIFLREVSDQQRNIFQTLAQRWDADWKRVPAIMQVAAELAILRHFLHIRLVAATSRTSTCLVQMLPSRSNSHSCRARSSLAWVSTGISPTSSRKRVP